MFSIQTRLLTPNEYSRPQTKLKSVQGVVIHWTANEGKGADAEANRTFFENRKAGKTGFGSAHYIVDNTEIVQCIPDKELAYHVGATKYKTTQFGSYPNDCLLGIEMCVNSDGNFKVVYEQTVQLAATLVKKYKLNPDTDIVRHYDITGKNCPGMFTSDHWGKTNNTYAVKYGVGSNADVAWKVFLAAVKTAATGKSSSTKVSPKVIVKPAAKSSTKKYVLPSGVLKQGASGVAVKQLQQALNAAKFTCSADGQYGPNTQEAVKKFQGKYCKPADGIYGPNTKTALDKLIN